MKQKWSTLFVMCISITLFFGGIIIGMLIQQYIFFQIGYEILKDSSISVDLNETNLVNAFVPIYNETLNRLFETQSIGSEGVSNG